MGEADLSALDEMLNRIQSLGLSDSQTSVYDHIEGEFKGTKKFNPPSTHIVATVEELTNVPDHASEKPITSDTVSDDLPHGVTPDTVDTRKQVVTPTHDVCMIDTPRDDDDPDNNDYYPKI